MAFADVGTWWGAQDREIDVVATDQRGRVVLAGSCKWTNRPLGVAEYVGLQRDLALAASDLKLAGDETGPWLSLFSREGFTDELRTLASAQDPPRLLLVNLDEMYAVSADRAFHA